MVKSLLDQLKQVDANELDARFEHLQQLTVMQPQDNLAFSCRGCGDKCCTTKTPIVLSIPEVWRMNWQVLRTPGLADAFHMAGTGATQMYMGHSSGLPVQMLNHVDGHCVFLAPMPGAIGERLYGCAIHGQRPNTCRVFPLGRIVAFDEQGSGRQEEFVLSGDCPGFVAAAPDEAVVEGYSPPNPAQTVQDWVDNNLPAEIRAETDLAFEVLKRFMESRVHAPTEAKPDGLLTPEFVMSAVARLFYVPPAPPRDPELEHALIMGRLEVMRDEGPELVLDAYEQWRQEKGPQ